MIKRKPKHIYNKKHINWENRADVGKVKSQLSKSKLDCLECLDLTIILISIEMNLKDFN